MSAAKNNQAAYRPEIRERDDGLYSVQSETAREIFYNVNLAQSSCNCPSHKYRDQECKHIAVVRAHVAAIELQKEKVSNTDADRVTDVAVQTTVETPEQKQLFANLVAGADRLVAMRGKAENVGCALLAGDLMRIAAELQNAVSKQRTALQNPVTMEEPDPWVIEIPPR